MLTFYLDGVETGIAGFAQNMGDLLETMDTTLGASGRLVTGIRIDGVDHPAFREPAMTDLALTGLHRIEMSSATPGEFALSCLNEAIGGLGAVSLACAGVAGQFRKGEISAANQALSEIIDSVASGLTLVAGVAPHLPFDDHAPALSRVLAETTRTVDALIAVQKRSDWAAVAGILEMDLPAALLEWVDVLAATAA